MKKLYALRFYSTPDGAHREAFHIGLFRSRAEAEAVEANYRKAVAGFKEYACDAEIAEVAVVGEAEGAACVYRYVGWNEDADLDEVDVIEGDCYVDRGQAAEALERARATYPRKEWALNAHAIGRCDWPEGFVRCGSEDA